MRRLFGVVVISLLGCSAEGTESGLPYYRSANLTPEWLDARAASDPSLHRIGAFDLTDQNGRRFARGDVEGRVYVASFFYTACTQICPTLRAQMGRVSDALGDGVLLVSHSITPEQDSVERLAEYARAQGLPEEGWHLLTGDADEIRRLAAASYFVELDDDTGNTRGDLMHTETLVLVDAEGRIRGVYGGTTAYDVSRLIEDARLLVGA